MKYAVKFYSDVPNPDEAPPQYPAVVAEIDDSVTEMSGYTIMTAAELAARKAEYQEVFDIWQHAMCRPLVIQYVRDLVDNKTSELTMYGFPYQLDGLTFRARYNDEDQKNYDKLVICKDMVPYSGPGRAQLKGYLADGSAVYANFANATEVITFYAAGALHIQASLNDGWIIKDLTGTLSTGQVVTTAVKDMTCEQLMNFTDPRT